MTDQNDNALRQMLRTALPPTATGPEIDLWPRMSRRLEERQRRIPWWDWVLAAATVVLLVVVPGAIPILLYQL